MDHGGLTYEQAEQGYAELERLRRAGQIGQADYAARLNDLRVTDEYGRTWMLQEGTGQWFVYHNEAWVAAVPPGREGRAPQPAIPVAPASGRRSRRSGRPRRKVGCLGLTLRILLWDLVWVGIGYLVYDAVSPLRSWLMIPLGVLAAATLVLWIRRLTPRVPQGAQA